MIEAVLPHYASRVMKWMRRHHDAKKCLEYI
nr:MAG TPA: ARS binding protein 2 [Caudoviricetes sp.]